MNYAKFYTSARNLLTDSLLSLWFRGRGKEQEYLRHVLTEEEPLLAEPVFQSIFPWESSDENFGEHATKLKILDQSFVDALSSEGVNEDMRFPKDRKPYKHQTKSWETMLSGSGKTIVVTSGTGSGKTECFMIPVLQDLARSNDSEGVQAIFLYPLNALMKSQQKRIHAWCSALSPQITYAIYNGDTEEEASTDRKKRAIPQLISRDQIRENPPQILFTNPTMLNYMLVRAKDQQILETSQGKLKWILLDEAHTYTGSAAAELALQLRRVLDAFGVTIDAVNFAVTSATIGDKDDPNTTLKLKKFVSQLTGKGIDSIHVIGGERVIPEMNEQKANEAIASLNEKFKFRTPLTLECVKELREQLNTSPALSASEIASKIDARIGADVVKSLELIDALADKVERLNADGESAALLPSRAHYFIRSISGLYVCVNPECKRHKDIRLSIGSLTTHQSINCPECQSKMLEVATCSSCGGSIVVGESSNGGYRMRTNNISLENNLFYDNEDVTDDSDDSCTADILRREGTTVFTPFYFAKPERKCLRRSATEERHIFNHEKGKLEGANIDTDDSVVYKSLRNDTTSLCPHCGNSIRRLNYSRTSATQLGRWLATVLLDHAEAKNADNEDVLYEGKKYITFTDNRQGSARSAMGLNQDVERAWIRSSIFRTMADMRLSSAGLTPKEEKRYNQLLEAKRTGSLIPIYKEDLEKLEAKKNGEVADAEVDLKTLSDKLESSIALKQLCRHLCNARSRLSFGNNVTPIAQEKKIGVYLKALLMDQFGRIPKRANSLETMGLVRLCYPNLRKANCPDVLLRHNCTNEDWQDFLKICIDYRIRNGRHYMMPEDFKEFMTQNNVTTPINKEKWNGINYNGIKVQENQSRFVLLLCAVLGYNDVNDFDEEKIGTINSLMFKAWDFIADNVLTRDLNYNDYYMLDLLGSNVKLQLMDKGYLCPVDNVIVDVTFCGYSPRMSGYISKENFERFKVKKEFTYPPFPFKIGDNDTDAIDKWIEENLAEQKDAGMLSNIHQRVYEMKPIFIAAEHSAQQTRKDLEQFEQDFDAGRLNILSCSTTMEMGVDIGGISEVVMNNVPPKSSNYLQRAGRAGRRSESKALALTFCTPTPIGSHTWHNPKYPITHLTATPLLKLESRQIVQRHVNALIFGKFILSHEAGMQVHDTLLHFFPGNVNDIESDSFKASLYSKFLFYIDEIIGGKDSDLVNSYESLVRGTAMGNMAISEAVKETKNNINSVYNTYSVHLDSLDKAIGTEKKGDKKNKKAAIERQRENLWKKSLLKYLADNSFLPTAGIPVGLVECVLDGHQANLDFRSSNPTQHLSLAISSYAPGNPVVKNEWIYEPKGIRQKAKYDNATSRYILQNCRDCGYTTISYGTHMEDCPKCGGKNTMYGVREMPADGTNNRFTEVVEPAAFSVAAGDEPTRNMNKQGTMNLIQPLLLNMEPWQDRSADKTAPMPKMTVRCSTPQSEILFFNRARYGFGYAFCPHCGRMEAETNLGTADEMLKNHNHLTTGRQCGNLNIHRHVLLVGRYQTDFVEIKFYDACNNLVRDRDTLYSLGVILSRKLTELLGVNDGEIDFGYNESYDSIFIFDTALGGAGYSTLFREYKDIVMDNALSSLEDCNCERACTKCLIDRGSQWYLNYLDRQKALEWLRMEKEARVAPEAISRHVPTAAAVTSDFATEFYNLVRNRDIQALTVFVNNEYDEWMPSDFPFRNMLQEQEFAGVKVTYVLEHPIDLSHCASAARTVLLSALFKHDFASLNGSMSGGLKPLLSVTFNNGNTKTYFGQNVNTSLSSSWGEGNVFSAQEQFGFTYTPIDKDAIINALADGDGSIMFDTRIVADSDINALLATLMEKKSDKWQKIKENIQGKKVELEYSDRYLHSPLGCMLLAHLVKDLKEEFDLTLTTFKIDVLMPPTQSTSITYVDRNFADSATRNKFLADAIYNVVGIHPTINDQGYLKHERVLSIKTDVGDLCIRPDAGIAYGWNIYGRENEGMTSDDFVADWNRPLHLFNRNKKGGILYTISYATDTL